MTVDNTQFTEEQRTEAFRVQLMQQEERQTRALESIRFLLWFCFFLGLAGVVILLFSLAQSSNGF